MIGNLMIQLNATQVREALREYYSRELNISANDITVIYQNYEYKVTFKEGLSAKQVFPQTVVAEKTQVEI